MIALIAITFFLLLIFIFSLLLGACYVGFASCLTAKRKDNAM